MLSLRLFLGLVHIPHSNTKLPMNFFDNSLPICFVKLESTFALYKLQWGFCSVRILQLHRIQQIPIESNQASSAYSKPKQPQKKNIQTTMQQYTR